MSKELPSTFKLLTVWLLILTGVFLAVLAWQGDERTLRSALGPHELAWLAEVQKIDRATLPDKLRHNLPDWLAGTLHMRTVCEGVETAPQLAAVSPGDLWRAQNFIPAAGLTNAADAADPDGDKVGNLRLERITEKEVWFHDGRALIKVPRFAGIERKSIAAKPACSATAKSPPSADAACEDTQP